MEEKVGANMDEDQELIAIVGFAGKFPGATDVEALWNNLKEGREALEEISDHELRLLGVPPHVMDNPHAVRKTRAVEGVELFDADFFQYTPGQACRIDPQQRLFLEVVWHALEHAGYDITRYPGSVGIFAGAAKSTYASNAVADPVDMQAEIDTGLGSIANRVSYKLNLRGPSVSVHTACSTSLVTVHLAAQSLLNFECDMALAGGASIHLPQAGYVYHKNGILSPDGHCRAYDQHALGTVPGNGVAVVVMKRLADAVADHDRVFAVVRGSAINNDGCQKVGYTAPSVEAQIAVVSKALGVAGVEARSIGLVEGHGTGTVLGDELELTALTEVFAAEPGEPRNCALGSIKANIGHLDVAAGVASLIKAVLCLSEKTLPPSINCSSPNALLMRPDSPFFINTMLQEWKTDGQPRRAAVTSLGIGGTNVHVVLEESQARRSGTEVRPAKANVFPLSARTTMALDAARIGLLNYLHSHPDVALEDVAFTLQVGRAQFAYRRGVIASDRDELLAALRDMDVDGEPVVSDYGAGKSPDQYPVRAARTLADFPSESETIDRSVSLKTLLSAWQRGAAVDWRGARLTPDGLRIPLPGYPFERKRHWLEPAVADVSCAKSLSSQMEPTAVTRACHEHPPAESTRQERTDLETAVTRIWQEVLKVTDPGVDARFLEVGGDSLAGIEVLERIEALFGVELSLQQLIRSGATIRTMARDITHILAGPPQQHDAAHPPGRQAWRD